MNDKSQSNYRWYILTLSALTVIFTVAMPSMSMPVLFKEIADDLQLSVLEIGTVWGMVSLAALIVMPLGGLISDRFGVRRVAITRCLVGGSLLANEIVASSMEIGVACAGTALGMVIAFQRIGGFIASPVGNSLANLNLGLPFVLWAVFGVFACVMFLFVRGTGKENR